MIDCSKMTNAEYAEYRRRIQEIEVINFTDAVEKEIYERGYKRDFSDWVEYCEFCQGPEGRAKLTEWLKKNNAHFYARDNEDFSLWEARVEAMEGGYDRVLVENLS